jgi:hypothetical protein
MSRIALEATYEDTQRLVRAAVSSFWQKHRHLEYQELLAEANLLFMKAYQTFMPGRGATFCTWLTYTINKGLTSILRLDARRARLLARSPVDANTIPTREACYFDKIDFLARLSDTAFEAVIIAFRYAQPNMLDKHLRHGVRQSLQALGWGRDRIRRVSREIMEALA